MVPFPAGKSVTSSTTGIYRMQPLPQPGSASEVRSCSPFPEEEQAVAAHRPASPVTVASQSLQTGSSTTQMQESSASIADETSSKKFWSRAEVVQLLEI